MRTPARLPMFGRGHARVLGWALLAVIVASGCTGTKAPAPPKENIFRFGLEQKVVTLDPMNSIDSSSTLGQALFYETLYHYDYLKRPFEVIPLLAQALPEFSRDRKSVTIRLKKGIRFHDDPCFTATGGKGREVTADDLIYMFERAAAPKTQTTTYSLFEHSVRGIREYHEGRAKRIAGVKALDRYTVRVELTTPSPRFAYKLLDIHSAIIPKEAVLKYGEGFAWHPVGTGAFLPVKIDQGNRIEAVRNPEYHDMRYPTEGNPGDREKGLLVDAGKRLPLVDKVLLEVVVEVQPRWLKFLNGELEIVGVPRDNTTMALPGGDLAPELKARGVQRLRQPRSDVVTVFFNMNHPVWGKNKLLRQAFSAALDRAEIVEKQYGAQAIPAESLVDPTQYGYDPAYKSRWSGADLTKARELLAQAGFSEGKGLPPLKLLSSAGTVQRQFNELLARQLARVGIRLESDQTQWPEMNKRLMNRNYEASTMAFVSFYPDIDDNTSNFHSRYADQGNNSAGYRNPQVDKLVDEIAEMDNGPARLAKIRALNAILDDELPYIPIVHRVPNQLSQPWLRNHVFVEQSYLGQFMKYHRTQVAGTGEE